MKAIRQHRRGILLIVAYVLPAILLEIGHRDVHDVQLKSDPVLSTHECGDNEIHLSPNQRHQCLACSHSLHRFALLLPGCLNPATDVFYQVWDYTVNDSHLPPDILHSGKRGPPRNPSL